MSDEIIGEEVERADGSVVRRTTNGTGFRRTWTPRWEKLTTAQLSSLRGAWEDAIQGAVNWSPPDDASSYSVIACGNMTYDLQTWNDENRYDVSGGYLKEVSP
jgi:hypothetical protein